MVFEFHGNPSLGKLTESLVGGGDINQDENLERDPLAVSSSDDQLFQWQALTLKLASANARILVQRPLLSYKVVKWPTLSTAESTTASGHDDYPASNDVRRLMEMQMVLKPRFPSCCTGPPYSQKAAVFLS